MVKPRELIRALERMGFRLLRKILRDIELDRANLQK
jgi:predicted RNA binding protein YcfA (HicA-like mRNA interferase family)